MKVTPISVSPVFIYSKEWERRQEMPDPMDYEKILAELMEERANLDRMITWVQSKLGRTEGEGVATAIPAAAPVGPTVDQMRLPRLRADAFFKMSVPEAIRAFLNMMKRPQSARQITDALEAGGLAHRAKDLYQTVFPTLQRMKEKGEVDKLTSGDWGLTEWYGAARKSAPAPETEEIGK